jgi:hypothetical protein
VRLDSAAAAVEIAPVLAQQLLHRRDVLVHDGTGAAGN